MSEFKVSQANLSDISRKYSGAISKTGMVRTIPLRVNTNLSIARQSGGDISIIKKNINVCIGEINRLYTDLIALRNGIEAVRTESEEADRNAKRVFKPFSFGSFVRRLIDMLKELLDEDNSIVTAANNIVSKLKEWSDQTEENQVIYVDSQVEPVVLILNDPYPDEPGTVHEIERVTIDDVQPNSTAHEEKSYSYTDNNGVTHLVIPGIGDIALNEYSEGSVYPNDFTVTIDGKSVYLAGAQCLGFARYVHEKIYGDHNIHNNSNFIRTKYSINGGQLTAEEAKKLITAGGVGAHIRTYNKDGYSDGDNGKWGHSQVVTEITEDGFTIIDANSDGDGTVRIKHYTWEEYVTTGFGRNGIYYIENKK